MLQSTLSEPARYLVFAFVFSISVLWGYAVSVYSSPSKIATTQSAPVLLAAVASGEAALATAVSRLTPSGVKNGTLEGQGDGSLSASLPTLDQETLAGREATKATVEELRAAIRQLQREKNARAQEHALCGDLREPLAVKEAASASVAVFKPERREQLQARASPPPPMEKYALSPDACASDSGIEHQFARIYNNGFISTIYPITPI